MTLQHITIEGKHFVLVPEEIYEALCQEHEAAEDSAEVIKRRHHPGENILGDVFHRITLHGEHPVSVYRQYRKITQSQLAVAAGISDAYLSQLEGGKRQGTIAVMKRIAAALDVSLDDLL